MSGTSISSVNAVSQSSNARAASEASLPGVDKEAFMQVLLAQLRHQNPLEPMDDKELIGQMAQLNSLQELQKINATLETLVDVSQQEDVPQNTEKG